jgi:hypothetical protein
MNFNRRFTAVDKLSFFADTVVMELFVCVGEKECL